MCTEPLQAKGSSSSSSNNIEGLQQDDILEKSRNAVMLYCFNPECSSTIDSLKRKRRDLQQPARGVPIGCMRNKVEQTKRKRKRYGFSVLFIFSALALALAASLALGLLHCYAYTLIPRY